MSNTINAKAYVTCNSVDIEWSLPTFAAAGAIVHAAITPPHDIQPIVSVPASAGDCSFHFLDPCITTYTISLVLRNQENTTLAQETLTVRTTQSLQRWNNPRVYIGPEHKLGVWVLQSPGDWGWTVCENINTHESRKFILGLFYYALFVLPHSGVKVLPIINPVHRYCIDLSKPIKWHQSKQLRRHKNDFTISMSSDFRRALTEVAKGQIRLKMSTWLIPELINAFVAMREHHKDQPVTHQSFELWEGDELVAVTVGFGVGAAFHDYSMFALKRDHRSCGSILSKAVGHLLQQCGYRIWYWGVKNEYMAEYDTKGGRKMDRSEFSSIWCNAVTSMPTKSLADEIAAGHALIAPKFPAPPATPAP